MALVAHASSFVLAQSKAAQPQNLPGLSNVAVQVSPDVAAAHLNQKVEPDYPAKALDAGIQGDVVLDVLIGKNGKVKNIKVASGDPVLSHAAVNAVKHWRYDPWASGTETQTTITLHFVISKGPTVCPGEKNEKYAFPSSPFRSEAADRVEGEEYAVFQVGPNVKPPRATYAPDPEYSDKARKAQRQGTAVMQVIVKPEGTVAQVKMERAAGYGLDQHAIDAVCQWKFTPATRDGKPVAVLIRVEVTFRLY